MVSEGENTGRNAHRLHGVEEVARGTGGKKPATLPERSGRG